jgi:tRNA pseudouridine38-40 synthase
MNYFLHIAYDGTAYRGWQRQLNAISVQEVLEKKLYAIFKYPVTVYGCGRTDAGVHASQYIINIGLPQALDFNLKFRLNKHLPNDIVVYEVLPMQDNQHARYDATLRTYDYFLHAYPDPVLDRYSTFYSSESLDVAAMQTAATCLLNYRDFRAVCKQPDAHKHTLCTLYQSQFFVSEDGKRLRFTISSNRFLKGMIRMIVAYLLKVGKGELTAQEFEQLVKNKQHNPYHKLAPPNGLFLSKIEYPYLSLATQPDICSLLKVGLC